MSSVSVTSSARMVLQFPGDDVAGEVVENRRQVHPAPADDLEVGEVRLPHQIIGLEEPVNAGF